MFQQAWSTEMVVPRTVSHRATDFSTRERSIVCILPAHREWREVPVAAAGNPRAVRVCFLVTADAIQTRHAGAVRTTHDIRDVTVAIVTLLRVVGGGVTVDATRRGQDGVDLF